MIKTGLFSSIKISAPGRRGHRTRMDVVSRNLANVSAEQTAKDMFNDALKI